MVNQNNISLIYKINKTRINNYNNYVHYFRFINYMIVAMQTVNIETKSKLGIKNK